ncbi:MAG: substrate-binding domain-containing protein [Rhodobacter sp.]|nr:substrate-binding domain-containing protein [Rhodobacter sp.]
MALLLGVSSTAAEQSSKITFGLTTTQEASGVSRAILEELESAFPKLELSYSVAGTSQQLRSLEDGFIPFAITHNVEKEKALTGKGEHSRTELFANDFLLVGPADQPLDCEGISACLKLIAESEIAFLSRGDGSGTHIYEMAQWQTLEVDPMLLPEYLVGSGGASSSLRICAIQDCFLIVDASSFEASKGRGLIEVARDQGANVYSLVYSSEFAAAVQPDVINWLATEVPALSEQYGYSAK